MDRHDQLSEPCRHVGLPANMFCVPQYLLPVPPYTTPMHVAAVIHHVHRPQAPNTVTLVLPLPTAHNATQSTMYNTTSPAPHVNSTTAHNIDTHAANPPPHPKSTPQHQKTTPTTTALKTRTRYI